MKEGIHPYQWELLAAMITYKVTGGLCLDYERLREKDFRAIHDENPSLPISSLRQWFNDRTPASSAFDELCRYVSDAFPYSDWNSFSDKESDIEMAHLCPNWKKYQTLKRSSEGTLEYDKLRDIKNWAYGRTIKLVKRNWGHTAFNFLHKQDSRIKEFSGSYQFFMPGQIPPLKFDPLYVDPLIIDEDGQVKFANAYIHKEYKGQAFLKDNDNLQIVIFSEFMDRKEGFEYIISIRLNNYGKKVEHFPGITLGFSGERNIIAYPILLTTDLTLSKTDKFVVKYFEECYQQFEISAETGRINCLTPLTVLNIFSKVHNLTKKKLNKPQLKRN